MTDRTKPRGGPRCRACLGKGKVVAGETRVGFAAARVTLAPCPACAGTGRAAPRKE